MTIQNTTGAETRMQDGLRAYSEGKSERAADAFIEAEKLFRQAGEIKRAGDARALLGDVQREKNLNEQAVASYQRAIKLYREAGRPLNEGHMELAIGHLERQQAHLDRAHDAYLNAQRLYSGEQNAQGLGSVALAKDNINEADARRSLADILRLAHRYEQAQQLY